MAPANEKRLALLSARHRITNVVELISWPLGLDEARIGLPGMIAALALLIWLVLAFAHGRFWASGPQLPPVRPRAAGLLPDLDIIVPARDESETIAAVVRSLLAQEYPGRFRLLLVDDQSVDRTAELAEKAAAAELATLSHATAGRAADQPAANQPTAALEPPSDASTRRFHVIRSAARPAGWSGKLWALSQGIARSDAPLLLFTDADIVHDPRHLASLVAALMERSPEQATLRRPRPHPAPVRELQMVSEMVRLNCESLPERALVPAFVYFFQMLYPFSRVNDASSRVAAAAGGTVLIRRDALDRAGGIQAIRHRLIDDVSLAQAIKPIGPIYLGHSGLASSIRRYPRFTDIWSMIARTAFTQLRHSVSLLVLTLLGLAVVWLVPVWALIVQRGWEQAAGGTACALAVASYQPTLARYRRSPLWALALPLIAIFYMAATAGSAYRHITGKGALWKNRAYGPEGPR